MRGEGGFSRVRGVPAHDDDRKLLLATTLDELNANRFKITRVFSGTYREVSWFGRIEMTDSVRVIVDMRIGERHAINGFNSFELHKPNPRCPVRGA